MKDKHCDITSFICMNSDKNQSEVSELFPGIKLSFLSSSDNNLIHISHKPMAQILEINYCIEGKIGWNMNNGNNIYLGPGDFSLNTMDICINSSVTLPNGFYKGLVIYIDLETLSSDPPFPLIGSPVDGKLLLDKFCKNKKCTALAGNERIQQIFQAFYKTPEELQPAYQKIKVIELLLVLSTMKVDHEKHLTEYRSEQIEIIRRIHDQLTLNLEQRFSIESLSKQFLMNPTTLKNMFKSIYGTSIAAHIREHRMINAADLLRSSDMSISVIARKVGYDSQSRFSSVFKKHYQMLPKEYRRKYLKKSD